MKCEHCGVENATFFCKTTLNGHTSQMHLCHGCAEKLGLTRSMHTAFSRPFGRLFDPVSLLGDFAHVSTPTLLTEFPAPDETATPPQEELVDAIDAKIVPLPGHVRVTNQSKEEKLRNEKRGV